MLENPDGTLMEDSYLEEMNAKCFKCLGDSKTTRVSCTTYEIKPG